MDDLNRQVFRCAQPAPAGMDGYHFYFAVRLRIGNEDGREKSKTIRRMWIRSGSLLRTAGVSANHWYLRVSSSAGVSAWEAVTADSADINQTILPANPRLRR